MELWNRRGWLRAAGLFGLASLCREAPPLARAATDAEKLRIQRFDLSAARVPFHERVREAWQRSFFLQNRFQTHHEITAVKLYADGGLVGVGDAMLPPARAREILEGMLGRSPWDYLLDDSIGGILVAVYDLLGKALRVPVARLFSTRPAPRIVQTWWSQCFPPALMASEAKLGYERGYRVHKVKARPWEDPIEQAAAICEAVPSDMRIWADANSWWRSVGRTKFFCARLAEFPQYFAIESPISRQHVAGYRELKGKLPLQLSEHLPPNPMPFVRERLVDAFVVGGPMGRALVQRALMAEVTKVPLWVEHSTRSGVNQVFQAHQAAAFPGIEYTISVTHVMENDLMKEPFAMKGGFYEIPAGPGLGVSFDEDALERYHVG